jgi:hypothetical protein
MTLKMLFKRDSTFYLPYGATRHLGRREKNPCDFTFFGAEGLNRRASAREVLTINECNIYQDQA